MDKVGVDGAYAGLFPAYAWLKGCPLFRVLEGSYEHHHIDHFPSVRDWFQQHPE